MTAPDITKIKLFLNLADNIIKNNGKVHIHCMTGSDRTGMYAFVYKMPKHIGSFHDNIDEWLKMGQHSLLYPNLIEKTASIISFYYKIFYLIKFFYLTFYHLWSIILL